MCQSFFSVAYFCEHGSEKEALVNLLNQRHTKLVNRTGSTSGVDVVIWVCGTHTIHIMAGP